MLAVVGCGGAHAQVVNLGNTGTGVLGTGITVGTAAPGSGLVGTGLTVNTTGAGGVAGTGVTIGTTGPGSGVLGTGATLGTSGSGTPGAVAGTAADSTVAIGDLTNLALRLNTSTADGAVAVGVNAGAAANGAIAIGRSATADQPNTIAIGADVRTTRTDQVVIGNTTNTYTMTGLASPASRAAQSGPTQFVTTDAAGNLGTSGYGPASIAALDSRVGSLEANVDRLRRDMRGAYQGTAIALALTGAVLPANKTFAVSANFGAYHGETGFGASGIARVSDNVFVSGGIGVATSGQSNVAGRGGVTVAW